MGKDNLENKTNSIPDMNLIRILALLNIVLYLDGISRIELTNNNTIKQIINKMSGKEKLSENNKLRVKILKAAIECDTYFASLKIQQPASKKLCASVFADGNNNYYIGFRGSRWNEWYEDVTALSGVQQDTAQLIISLKYFENTVKELNLCQKNNIILFGHSNGGLKAQHILFNSKCNSIINEVYAFCSQKFCPEHIEHFQEQYKAEQLTNLINKINLVDTYGDLVHCFGNTKEGNYFIPEDNRIYLCSNFNGTFRSHFAESIFYSDSSLTQQSDKKDSSKTEKRIIKISNRYMSHSPKVRKLEGNIIMFVFKFCRVVKIDRIVDKVAKSHEIHN